jgi:hypothetical protein
METNFVLNYKKCHFMVEQWIVLGHVVFARGLEVDKVKIHIILSLLYPASVQEVCSLLRHEGFYPRFIKNFLKVALPLCRFVAKDANFMFGQKKILFHSHLKLFPSKLCSC